MTEQPLLETYQLGPAALSNRMVMAPMTRTRAFANGVPSKMMLTYYAQRASAGLIITECTRVSEQAHGIMNSPGLYDLRQIQGWRAITNAVHRKQGKIYAQLWHCGRVTHSSMLGGETPVAPSALPLNGGLRTPKGPLEFETPRALSTQEISGIVEDFRMAARSAMAAGFDGVELHGAYGYLIDQFLQDSSNHREDRYGGSVLNRCRLALEIAEAVASVCGPELVGFRVSPSTRAHGMLDSDPVATFGTLARELSAMSIGYLHVMEPSPEDLATDTVKVTRTTQALRPLFKQTVITNVGYDRVTGNEAISLGLADLVAFGKPFISNPDLPDRFRFELPLCPWDSTKFYGYNRSGYTDYWSAAELQFYSWPMY